MLQLVVLLCCLDVCACTRGSSVQTVEVGTSLLQSVWYKGQMLPAISVVSQVQVTAQRVVASYSRTQCNSGLLHIMWYKQVLQ